MSISLPTWTRREIPLRGRRSRILAIVGAGLGFALSRFSISKPLATVVGCLRELAKGDLKVTIFGIGRKDEVGDIAEALQVFKDNLTETQRRALVIADNQLAITGSSWNEELLQVELQALQEDDFDLELLGFSDEEGLTGRPILAEDADC